MNNALSDSKYLRIQDPVAAGTADTTESDIIDMQGFDSVEFITSIGTITATGTVDVQVQQDSDSAGGSMADLLGTKISYTAADGDKLAVHDIHRPKERYLRVTVVRATANAVIDLITARLYNAKSKPVTQDTDHVVGSELHASPAEGTA